MESDHQPLRRLSTLKSKGQIFLKVLMKTTRAKLKKLEINLVIPSGIIIIYKEIQ